MIPWVYMSFGDAYQVSCGLILLGDLEVSSSSSRVREITPEAPFEGGPLQSYRYGERSICPIEREKLTKVSPLLSRKECKEQIFCYELSPQSKDQSSTQMTATPTNTGGKEPCYIFPSRKEGGLAGFYLKEETKLRLGSRRHPAALSFLEWRLYRDHCRIETARYGTRRPP